RLWLDGGVPGERVPARADQHQHLRHGDLEDRRRPRRPGPSGAGHRSAVGGGRARPARRTRPRPAAGRDRRRPPRTLPRPAPPPHPLGRPRALSRPPEHPPEPPAPGARPRPATTRNAPAGPLATTGELVSRAAGARSAVAYFNIIALEHIEAVIAGAESVNAPVVLQVSENAVRFRY